MSVHKLKGRIAPHLMEKLKHHPHADNGSWIIDGAEWWLALHRHHDQEANEWDLTEAGPVNLQPGPFDDPSHGPNPISMPMRDNQWGKIVEHDADPGTGLLGKPGEDTYVMKARIEAPKARAICRKVD